jgi:hypothetical protein
MMKKILPRVTSPSDVLGGIVESAVVTASVSRMSTSPSDVSGGIVESAVVTASVTRMSTTF